MRWRLGGPELGNLELMYLVVEAQDHESNFGSCGLEAGGPRRQAHHG